jgi:hypothetical protein
LLATRRDQLAKNAKGLPKMQASDSRLLIIGHLAQALPAREAGAEVSLAIAGVAADSLSSMIPGLLGGGQAQGMLNGQRQRLMEQIGSDLNNTLLYVYRDLSDDELESSRPLPSRQRARRITRRRWRRFGRGWRWGKALRTWPVILARSPPSRAGSLPQSFVHFEGHKSCGIGLPAMRHAWS